MQVLAISTHPDDETLGCGGTLLKHRAASSRLFWLIVTQPNHPQWSVEEIKMKTAEVEQVAEKYRMEKCFRLGFPTVELDRIGHADLMKGIQDVVSEVRPEIVYLVHGGDVHTDHKAVFTATMSILKPSNMARFGVRRVLCYEVLSSTEGAPPLLSHAFLPSVFSDISTYVEQKIEIMGLYETESQPDPFPREPSAIRALARYRGATIGVKYAEAFMLIRELI